MVSPSPRRTEHQRRSRHLRTQWHLHRHRHYQHLQFGLVPVGAVHLHHQRRLCPALDSIQPALLIASNQLLECLNDRPISLVVMVFATAWQSSEQCLGMFISGLNEAARDTDWGEFN